MRAADPYGYLLVHFVEDRAGHGERVHLSLSEGDDPLRWRRLRGGEPVLESRRGTTGVRDPHLVRRPDGAGFHLVATDLRVWRPEGPDWEEFGRHGSRDVVVWDSPDLLSWSPPRHVTVAPPNAGMAWAPEVFYDQDTGVFVVHFAAALYAEDDPLHEGEIVPRIMTTTTRDLRGFTPPEPYLELPGGVIDMTVVRAGGEVHRFAKQGDDAPGSWQVFHQVGASFFHPAFRTLATGLGQGFGPAVEGPLVFPTHDGSRWYLWVDQYGRSPQGYRALTTTDIASGEWEPVPDGELQLPANTKHGAVLPLLRGEWKGLARL
ncbi:glycoside hydrolase family 43 protein [Krasilnikoviella flava]|uniref:Glycosyl hydrolases family 43 n=1 Tax=Krasilnikoviella flava TaxID=526729 RepID=A0A1T5LMR9_9MICO|nr:glycoside hydrolase family 43 protein [Krasilnikoviella flava]SKC76768.1 hypothetical protein SAMN04324258_3636 [Krasilnikoviella flava]